MSAPVDYLATEALFLRASHRLVARTMRKDGAVLLRLRSEIARLALASDAFSVTEWHRLLARPAVEVRAALTRDEPHMNRLRQFSLVSIAATELRDPAVRARLRAAAAKIAGKRTAERTAPAEPVPPGIAPVRPRSKRRRRRKGKSRPSTGS